jgi:hypothetical protein
MGEEATAVGETVAVAWAEEANVGGFGEAAMGVEEASAEANGKGAETSGVEETCGVEAKVVEISAAAAASVAGAVVEAATRR